MPTRPSAHTAAASLLGLLVLGVLGPSCSPEAHKPIPPSTVGSTVTKETSTMNDALLNAATSGDAEAVAAAVQGGADIEARDSFGHTALLLAATNDRKEAAQVLVDLGADPNALDDQSDTPWLVTGVTGSVEMAEILLKANPDLTIRNRFGGISIIPASERGHVDYVRRVVKTSINVNHVNNLGWTALLEAVILGDGSAPYQQIIQILLNAGADPTLADRDGVTALQHAGRSGQTEVARILTEYGARAS